MYVYFLQVFGIYFFGSYIFLHLQLQWTFCSCFVIFNVGAVYAPEGRDRFCDENTERHRGDPADSA